MTSPWSSRAAWRKDEEFVSWLRDRGYLDPNTVVDASVIQELFSAWKAGKAAAAKTVVVGSVDTINM